MRMRTFIADSMVEAVAQVREAMGDDAIIVSSLEGENGGFEVTAALDQRATDTPNGPPAEDTALQQILREHLNAAPKTEPPSPTTPGERVEDQREPAATPVLLSETALLQVLEDQGVPGVLANALVSYAMSVDTDNSVTALAAALEDRFHFDPLPIAPPHPIMAVGLPGHGKTVTIAKLAARATIENVRSQIISTDAERTGAEAQAEAYGNLLKIPVDHVETIDAMGLVLDQRTDRIGIEAADGREACFIDTAAANPFQTDEFQTLRRKIEASRSVAAAEPILILAASGDPKSMAETAQEFSKLGISRMVVTQLDISRRIGGILAAAEIAGLSFAQFSDTPYLARGVAAATPLRLSQVILGHAQSTPLTDHTDAREV